MNIYDYITHVKSQKWVKAAGLTLSKYLQMIFVVAESIQKNVLKKVSVVSCLTILAATLSVTSLCPLYQ